jgi:hypothetical protein
MVQQQSISTSCRNTEGFVIWYSSKVFRHPAETLKALLYGTAAKYFDILQKH